MDDDDMNIKRYQDLFLLFWESLGILFGGETGVRYRGP